MGWSCAGRGEVRQGEREGEKRKSEREGRRKGRREGGGSERKRGINYKGQNRHIGV